MLYALLPMPDSPHPEPLTMQEEVTLFRFHFYHSIIFFLLFSCQLLDTREINLIFITISCQRLFHYKFTFCRTTEFNHSSSR